MTDASAYANLNRTQILELQITADAEWDRAQRTGVTSAKKCPSCTHRIYEHDRTDDAEIRNCRDCGCDRYTRVL
jgi:hypothetical protein